VRVCQSPFDNRFRHRAPRARAGFTLIELMVVIGIMATAAAMAALLMPTAIQTAKADGGMATVVAALRTAREQAISQRRNVIISFNDPNQIVASRENVPSTAGTTVIGTTYLENGVRYMLVSGVPDTPDAFGNAATRSFGTATTFRFSSEGTFVDQNGDPLNGTVFLARWNDPLSARAVTIFGPTALIRQWRWDGVQWTK
jgi:prepilin-type N-terminal cleavage/methylation domain-containing protein